jgi:hypothetical protein
MGQAARKWHHRRSNLMMEWPQCLSRKMTSAGPSSPWTSIGLSLQLLNAAWRLGWRKELVAPGCVSLLTHSAQSHWRWSEDIEVTHLYLSPGAVTDVAAEAYQRHIKDIELGDVLKADDPVLAGIAASLAREAEEVDVGGRLYVESLRNLACVHVLRRYANVTFREPGRGGGLSRPQCQLLNQYLEENLDRDLPLLATSQLCTVISCSAGGGSSSP